MIPCSCLQRLCIIYAWFKEQHVTFFHFMRCRNTASHITALVAALVLIQWLCTAIPRVRSYVPPPNVVSQETRPQVQRSIAPPATIKLPRIVNQDEFYTRFNFECAGGSGRLCAILCLIQNASALRDYNGMYVANIGANDGKTIDPVYHLFAGGASGVAIEPNAELYGALRVNLPWDRVLKIHDGVNEKNVHFLLTDLDFTVIKLDIDSFDAHILHVMLQGGKLRPAVLILEINEKIPPPIVFSVNYFEGPPAWAGDHCYGASITKLVSTARRHQYEPVLLDWNNLVLVDWKRYQPLFQDLDTSVESLYNTGYWQRQGRTQNFPWNSNVQHWIEDVMDKHLPAHTVIRPIFEHMQNTLTVRQGSTFELTLSHDPQSSGSRASDAV